MKQLKNFFTQIKDVDKKGQVLVAANAIGNIDSDNDRSMSGSFNKTIKENFKRVKWFLNHDTRLLLGVPLEAKERSAYLQILGQLNMNKELSRDIYEDYKLYAEHGRTLEHSIGVEAKKYKIIDDVREVSEWMLWEYSTLTNWGANSDTPMLDIKSASAIYDEIKFQETRLKKGNYTDEKFKQIDLYLLKLKHSLTREPELRATTYLNKPKAKIKAIDSFIDSLV
jgi:HK97 family phage prohead protease